ncbi:unnamed protein product [Didymodactylos carnosus]|uniref:Uncharacterized protein n=1 Tax=Didymodactylos carnosus TaxID=1234261 RepID=A0A8S2FJM5_9BILA|nr:unnamed protein product [Didymodactylos carnosus]CAF4277246.1 unnamed protein product [Didymodactylos carnosus]
MLRKNAVEQLWMLLDKTSMPNLQTRLLCTLWTLTGEKSTKKRDIATKIGVKNLVTFYSIKSEDHLFVITDILYELARRTANIKMNIQEEISQTYGIQHLIRLLNSDDEKLVLCAIRTLSYLAVGPGFVPNRKNQEIILKSDGIPVLVALMMYAKSEIIQAEAGQALAYVALTNSQCSTVIENTLNFSYGHIINMIKTSADSTIQLIASNTLATFAYNNSRVLLNLCETYSLSFDYFNKFLTSSDDYSRCLAAFQIVVLSGLISERKQSITNALGCGNITDVLRMSKSDDNRALSADCIARLSHLKSDRCFKVGVTQALIAVDCVDLLCDLFSSVNDIAIGNAALALGYLSLVPEGQRKLLHRCRAEPDIMPLLKFYNCLPNQTSRLSLNLIEDWNRYQTFNMPKLRCQKTISHTSYSAPIRNRTFTINSQSEQIFSVF